MSISYLQKTNRDVISSYETLFIQVWNGFTKYDKKYGNQDYRSVFFGTYCETLLWALVQLENFSNLNPQPIISKRFENLTVPGMTVLLLQYDTINRQAFAGVTTALVEDFINALCQELFSESFTNYSKSIKKLCDKIFPENSEKFYKLYSLYLIRNSLHNNGYIKILKNDYDLKIGKRIYKFRKGQQIQFAGWDNIFIITKELLNVIVEVVENKYVQCLPKVKHKNVLISSTDARVNQQIADS